MAATLRPSDDGETAREGDDVRPPKTATEAATRDRRVQSTPPPVYRTTSSSRFLRNLARLHDAT